MPITYNMPFSQFVDPGSTEISEMLRERFMNNYQASSQLEMEMSNLKAAPFEGDRKLRDSLVTSTQGTLNSVAERGDYENMTLPVLSAAKEYSIKSAPIQQNAANYQAFLEEVETAYKEGNLKHDDYMGTIALATHGYTGLTQNPDGTYGNLFKGIDLVYDPKIEEKISDAFDGIVEHHMGALTGPGGQGGYSKVQIVGVDSEKGKLTISREGKITTISDDRIKSILSNVFADGQVQAYLQRKAEIKHSMKSDTEIETERTNYMSALRSQYDQIVESEGKLKGEDRERAEVAKGNILQTLGQIQTMNADQFKSVLMDSEKEKMVDSFTEAAMAKYYKNDVDLSYSESYDPEYIQKLNSYLQPDPVTTIPGEIKQSKNVGFGQTMADINDNLNNINTHGKKLEDPKYVFEQFGVNMTGEEALNMTAETFAAQHPGESMDGFIKLKNAVSSQVINNKVQESVKTRARRLAEIPYKDSKDKLYSAEIGTTIGGEKMTVESAVQTIMNNDPNLSEEQALRVLLSMGAAANSGFVGSKDINGHAIDPRIWKLYSGHRNYDSDDVPWEGFQHLNNGNELFNQFVNTTSGSTKGTIFSSSEFRNAMKAAIRESDNDTEAINAKIEDITTVQFSAPLAKSIPGVDKEHQASIENLYKNVAPRGGHTYIDPFTQEKKSFADVVQTMMDNEYGAFASNNMPKDDFVTNPKNWTATGEIDYNFFTTGPQGPTMTINYSLNGEKNAPNLAIEVPLSELSGNPQLTAALTSPMVPFLSAIGTQANAGINNMLIPITDLKTNETSYAQLKLNTESGGTVILLDPNKNPIGATFTLSELLNPTGPIANLAANNAAVDLSKIEIIDEE